MAPLGAMRKNFKSQLMLHVLDGGFHVPIADNRDTGFDLQMLSNLPKDLFWRVLQELPYSVKARLGTVSKTWHSNLLSIGALRSSASTALPSPSPLLCGLEYIEDRETTGCSEIQHRDLSSICKVYELDLSFLPEECLHWCSPHFFVQEGLIGVVGGISNELRELTLQSGSSQSELSSLGICLLNPMTRTWRKLPTLTYGDQKQTWKVRDQMEMWNTLAEGHKWRIKVKVDPSSVSSGKVQFEVILLLPGSKRMSIIDMSVAAICTYSSLTDKWAVTKSKSNKGPSPRLYFPAVCHGFIYTVRDYQWLTTHSLLDGKLCGTYDLQTISTAQTGHHSLHFLVEHQGDVLCVQEIPTNVEGCATFGIWKLNPTSMSWSELTIVPRVVLDRFLARMYRAQNDEYNLYSVRTVGEFVCLNVYDQRILHANDAQDLLHVLICHIPTKRWQIGFNNLLFNRLERRFELFQPRLDIFL